MLDIGGWEFLLIAILGIMIIGPKELPGAIRTVSMFVRRARERAVRAGCGARGAGGRYREHEEQVEAQAADEEGEEQASEHVRELVGAEEEEKG